MSWKGGAPAQDGVVEVEGAVGGAQHHDLGVLVREHAVPELHELRLERCDRLVLVRLAAAEQRVDLVCKTAAQRRPLSASPCLPSRATQQIGPERRWNSLQQLSDPSFMKRKWASTLLSAIWFQGNADRLIEPGDGRHI
jgi:hypothetical protein